MVEIILEVVDVGVISIDSNDFNKTDLIGSGGKSLIQLIKDDIASNIDSTGWSKYRKTLKALNLISESDVSKWNIKKALEVHESLSANP